MLEGTQEGVQGGDCKIAAEGGDEGGGGGAEIENVTLHR